MDILVSIIIPVYKVESYLRQSVDSILNQTFSKYELILVDDGSPDSCPKICDEYAKQDDKIKVIHKDNGGLVSAVTAGISIAMGKYLCFVDSDDWIEPDMVEILYKKAVEYDYDVVVCGYIKDYISEQKQTESFTIRSGSFNKSQIIDEIYPTIINGKGLGEPAITGSRCGKLFKREVVLHNLPYYYENISRGEDWLLTLPALLDSQNIYLLEGQYLYHYRMNESSITHTYNPNIFEDWLRWQNYLMIIAKEKEIYDFSDQFDRMMISSAFAAIQSFRKRWRIDKQREIVKRIYEICHHSELSKLTCWKVYGLTTKEKFYVFLIKHKAARLIYMMNSILEFKSRRRMGK